MTGTSARETSRPAKRPRPSATDQPHNIAPPPVLFRLPSIGQPAYDQDRFGTPAAMPHAALAMDTSGAFAASLATSVPAAPHSATAKPVAAPSPALADKKAAGQRLLNTLMIAVLLIALAIISMLAFRGGQPAAKPELAGSEGQSKDQLGSLSEIRVPDISSSPMQSASAPSPSAETAGGQSVEASKALSPSGLQLSLDKTRSTSGPGTPERSGLTLDAADLAKKPNTGGAQVQLGTPVPMRSSSPLASSQEKTSQPGNSGLPLTTPRYETVSTPSSPGGAPASGSGTASGASPSLWDGAKKPANPQGEARSDLMLSGANDSEMSLIPSDYSSSSAQPTGAQPVSAKNAAPASSNTPTASAESSSLGVTVGAGMREPEFPQAKATATPDLDVAAISNKFVEYSRQKSVTTTTASTEIVNPYAPVAHPAAHPATATAPATTAAANSYATGGYQQQSPSGAGVPYGTTGATMTPYVRNTPTGAAPSGLGGGAMQSAYPMGNQNTTPMPGPSASTVYPSLTGATNYPQASAANSSTGYNPGYSAQSSSGNGFAIPPRGSATASPQATAGAAGATMAPAPSGAYGYPAAQNYGTQNYGAQNGYAAGATAPASGASYQTAPVSNSPYPGGQAPQGMIGQSGFATAPTGDIAPPMPVTGKIGYGTSPTR